MPKFINFQERNEAIEKIITIEWNMFQKVSNINGRAACQDEWETFHIMRYSQYNAWSDDMIHSYMDDLDIALKTGRNLITEKYGYMMEFTQNEYYKQKLEPYLPKVDSELLHIIQEITQYMVKCEKEISLKYPKLGKAGRVIQDENIPETNETIIGGTTNNDTTVETYAIGELKTFSEKTLKLYLDFVRENKKKNINMVLPVKDMMVKMSGYSSLEDAESKL